MTFDVIIVGAGPAGAMAAGTISKEGYSVLVIDKKKRVGYPVQCAEALSHFALEYNGIKPKGEWVKSYARGIKMFVPSGKYFLFLEDVYCIDRQGFDQSLIRDAVDTGSEISLDMQVGLLKRHGDLWHVHTKDRRFISRILIGADGARSGVAHQLGILKKRESLKGINYKFSMGDTDFPEDMPCLFFNSRFSGGYAWVFPRGDEYSIGMGGIDDFSQLRKTLDEFCNSMGFSAGKRKSMSTGLIPINYALENFERDSAMISGDAAGLTNPIFGGGIHAALYSGRMAGEVACRALESGSPSQLSEYNTLLRSSPFCDPVLQRGREILYSFTDKEWNFVGDVFEGQDWRRTPTSRIMQYFTLNPGQLARIKKFWTVRKAIDMSTRYGW